MRSRVSHRRTRIKFPAAKSHSREAVKNRFSQGEICPETKNSRLQIQLAFGKNRLQCFIYAG